MKRRQLTPEEIAERANDPSELTRQAFRHPWMAGLGSGVIITAWALAIDVAWPVAVGGGLALLGFTGLVWRPGGPAQRWRRSMLQRFPKKGNREP